MSSGLASGSTSSMINHLIGYLTLKIKYQAIMNVYSQVSCIVTRNSNKKSINNRNFELLINFKFLFPYYKE